jgi:glutamate/aspartate transport system substrate-binding protein
MRFVLAHVALACVMAGSATAQAQEPAGTLDKIQSTGKVVMGVRESSAPMAYAFGTTQKYVGYHVELCEKVLAQIVPKASSSSGRMVSQGTGAA